jgi:hypothetical protein
VARGHDRNRRHLRHPAAAALDWLIDARLNAHQQVKEYVEGRSCHDLHGGIPRHLQE